MNCNEILQQGIFNKIIVDTNRDISSNFLTWLSTASYSDVKAKINAGLKIALPLKGVPLSLGGDFSEDKFNEWKSQLGQGESRTFTEQESMKIISSNVDPTLVNAWLECNIKTNGGLGQTGLLGWFDGPSDGDVIVFVARYLPTGINDYPPTISTGGFQITGGTTSYPLSDGREIPLAGVSVLITRQGDQRVTIVLNTTKGTVNFTSPLPTIKQTDLKFVVERIVDDPKGYPHRYNLQFDGRERALKFIQRVDYQVNMLNYWGAAGARGYPDGRTDKYSSNNNMNKYLISFSEPQPVVEIIATVTTASGSTWNYSYNVE